MNNSEKKQDVSGMPVEQNIPIDWLNEEFQKKFIAAFNHLQQRVLNLEGLTKPLLKQFKIEMLEKEIEKIRKE